MLDWGEKNFADCDLGDERLNNRAYGIGQTLSQGILLFTASLKRLPHKDYSQTW
ncbi:MAG TPA: transposase DNA-binding-containing protein [Nostocaceae cyanobacterium]|nr:transposase DNA-binding-containing protein [Nostocaceae cyanobacterium]